MSMKGVMILFALFSLGILMPAKHWLVETLDNSKGVTETKSKLRFYASGSILLFFWQTWWKTRIGYTRYGSVTTTHCSDKIIGAQVEAKKVPIIPWYNWNILPEEDLECNKIIQRPAFPRNVIISFRILCPLRSFKAEQNNSEEILFW